MQKIIFDGYLYSTNYVNSAVTAIDEVMQHKGKHLYPDGLHRYVSYHYHPDLLVK